MSLKVVMWSIVHKVVHLRSTGHINYWVQIQRKGNLNPLSVTKSDYKNLEGIKCPSKEPLSDLLLVMTRHHFGRVVFCAKTALRCNKCVQMLPSMIHITNYPYRIENLIPKRNRTLIYIYV